MGWVFLAIFPPHFSKRTSSASRSRLGNVLVCCESAVTLSGPTKRSTWRTKTQSRAFPPPLPLTWGPCMSDAPSKYLRRSRRFLNACVCSASLQKTCARWSTLTNACPSASANSTASPWEDPSTAGFTMPAANASDLNAWTMAARQ